MLSSVKRGPSGLQRVILSDRLDSDPLIPRSLSALPVLREDTQQQVVEGLFLIVHASVTVDCLHNRVRRQGVSTGKTVLKVRKLRDF